MCFEYNVLRVKMKFGWNTGAPVGVKGLTTSPGCSVQYGLPGKKLPGLVTCITKVSDYFNLPFHTMGWWYPGIGIFRSKHTLLLATTHS